MHPCVCLCVAYHGCGPTSYQRQDAWLIVAACFAAMVNGATMPVFSLLFARIIDVLFEADPVQMREDAQWLMIAFIISGVGAGICRIGQVCNELAKGGRRWNFVALCPCGARQCVTGGVGGVRGCAYVRAHVCSAAVLVWLGW